MEKIPNNKGFLLGLFLYPLVWHFRICRHVTWGLFKQFFTAHRKIREIPKRTGDVAVITGGNKCFGAEIVRQLMEADMTVIIGCRGDTDAANNLIQDIRTSGIVLGTAEVMNLDLGSLESVRTFATKVMEMDIPLQILINNATCISDYEKTVDGFEVQFQVNYLSHFLLTLLLLPALALGGTEKRCSRVINVSSIAYLAGKPDWNDLTMGKYWNQPMAVANSKLFQVVMSNYLNRRCKTEKLPIRSFSVDPGIISNSKLSNIHFLDFMTIPPNKGADAVVYTALSEMLQDPGGKLMANCKFVCTNSVAKDVTTQHKLWEETCSLLKVEWAKGKTDGSQSLIIQEEDPLTIVEETVEL